MTGSLPRYGGSLEIVGFDHIVLTCLSVLDMVAFHRDVLGLRVGEERPGKWAIWFGSHKAR